MNEMVTGKRPIAGVALIEGNRRGLKRLMAPLVCDQAKARHIVSD
jgi:hypothetical protein